MCKNIFAAFAAAVLLAFATFASAQTLAERPDIKAGTSLKYSFIASNDSSRNTTYVETIQSVSSEIKAQSRTEKGEVKEYSYTLDHNLIMKSSAVLEFFHWPLVAGGEWSYQYDDKTDSGNTRHNAATAKVVGSETVTVPAGTFTTVKVVVVIKTTIDGRDSGTITDTLWYSPEVASYVRWVWSYSGSAAARASAYETTRELAEYHLGRSNEVAAVGRPQ